MQISLDTNNFKYVIEKYTNDGIVTISQKEYTSSLIIMPNHLEAWDITNIQQLTYEACQNIIAQNPEVIIFGSGKEIGFPSIEVTSRIMKLNIGVEVMSTAAACRTYTILAAEGRKVAAALILP